MCKLRLAVEPASANETDVKHNYYTRLKGHGVTSTAFRHSRFLCVLIGSTGVILIGDVITTSHCLVRVQLKGCQVEQLFVGNGCIQMSRFF